MYHWFTLLSLVTLCCCENETKSRRRPLSALKVTAHTQSDVDLLMNITSSSMPSMPLESNVTVGSSMVFITALHKPGSLDDMLVALRSHGLDPEVIDDPIQAAITHQKRYEIAKGGEVFTQASRFRDLVLDKFHSADEIIQIVRAAHNTYPDITEVVRMGESGMGTPILALKIGSKESNKMGVYIDAGYNGVDWITSAASVYLINHLLTNYTNNNIVTKLLNKFDWYIAPLINPDGLSYSMERDRLWEGNRRNCESKTCCNPTRDTYKDGYSKANLFQLQNDGCCQGVIINLNFDFNWKSQEDYRCRCCYPGSNAFSEKESVAVRDFILSHPKTLMFAKLNCCTNSVYMPYDYTKPDNYNKLLRIGELGAKDMGSVVRNGTFAGTATSWALVKAGVPYAYDLSLPMEKNMKRGKLLRYLNWISPSSKIVPYGEKLVKSLSAMANALISEY